MFVIVQCVHFRNHLSYALADFQLSHCFEVKTLNVEKSLPLMLFHVFADVMCSVQGAALPNQGSAGTRVTIQGVFAPSGGGGAVTESVTIAGFPATIVSQSGGTVVVIAGSPLLGNESGTIRVISDTGAYAELEASEFTYLASGTITSVTPDSGQHGTLITINGTNLYGNGGAVSVSEVTFGGVPAREIVSHSDTSVVARPGGRAAGINLTITVQAADGATAQLLDVYEHLEDGVITDVRPRGATTGTVVSITGTTLLGHASTLTSLVAAGVDVRIDIKPFQL